MLFKGNAKDGVVYSNILILAIYVDDKKVLEICFPPF